MLRVRAKSLFLLLVFFVKDKMLILGLMVAVYANCTDWPVLLRENERELLAADRDGADVVDEDSDAVAGDAVEVSEAEFDDSAGAVNF